MARNQEKTQSMLYRFREAEMAERTGMTQSQLAGKRPLHTHMIQTLIEAERWRGSVIRDIIRKVSRIHDLGLNEGQIRELNDEINDHFREKWLWEKRVAELGGPDYTRMGDSGRLAAGLELPGRRRYKYFGRARDLPDVKKAFEETLPGSRGFNTNANEPFIPRLRFDRGRLDAEYFGYFADSDQDLVRAEAEYEAKAVEKNPHLSTLQDNTDNQRDSGNIQSEHEQPADPVTKLLQDAANRPTLDFVPTVNDVSAWMLERRKEQLLRKYSS